MFIQANTPGTDTNVGFLFRISLVGHSQSHRARFAEQLQNTATANLGACLYLQIRVFAVKNLHFVECSCKLALCRNSFCNSCKYKRQSCSDEITLTWYCLSLLHLQHCCKLYNRKSDRYSQSIRSGLQQKKILPGAKRWALFYYLFIYLFFLQSQFCS